MEELWSSEDMMERKLAQKKLNAWKIVSFRMACIEVGSNDV